MYNYIDELSKQFKIFNQINKYSYVVYVKEGMTESELYKVKNDNFLYMIDNGSPKNNILPFNINRRFKEWFFSEIEPRMENDLFEEIIDNDESESCIMICFEKYLPTIESWYKNELRKMKVLDIDMNKFANQIYCKIIHKDI